MRRHLIKAALLFLACASFARPASADGTISGRMSWVSGNVLVYKDSRGLENRIQVDPQAQITQNGRAIPLDQLKWGAFLTIVYVDRPFAPVAVAIDAASRFGFVVPL